MVVDDSAPRYLPHRAQTEVLAMGLTPLAATDWVEVDSSLGRFHAHKRRLGTARRNDVYRWLPESLPAQAELAEQLLGHLLTTHGDYYERRGDTIDCLAGAFSVSWPPAVAADTLWRLSLLVAEDLILMAPGPGGYRMVAASLCSPSHWRLAEKIGRPLRAIHDPIPGVHDSLSSRIDRFFDHLRPERPVQRFNWSLQTDPELFHPGRSTCPPPGTPLYYRVERQTLVRLPRTGVVAFTIRVFLHPLECLRACPGALGALLAAVDATPPALAAYKGFDTMDAALAPYRLSS